MFWISTFMRGADAAAVADGPAVAALPCAPSAPPCVPSAPPCACARCACACTWACCVWACCCCCCCIPAYIPYFCWRFSAFLRAWLILASFPLRKFTYCCLVTEFVYAYFSNCCAIGLVFCSLNRAPWILAMEATMMLMNWRRSWTPMPTGPAIPCCM